MAYAGTVTRAGPPSHGNRPTPIQISLAETEAAATSEKEITGLPKFGRIMRLTSSLTSGTGTVLDPIVGVLTAPAGANVVVENGDPAAIVDLQNDAGYRYYSSTGSLFIRTRVNDATADHVIATKLLILPGWGD